MRVLVADDDAVTRRTLVGLLGHLGHESIEELAHYRQHFLRLP